MLLFLFWTKRFETILSLHTQLCFLHGNFSRVSLDKGRLLLNARAEEKKKKEKNTSMVMSDRAANCVLGDKDGGKREK